MLPEQKSKLIKGAAALLVVTLAIVIYFIINPSAKNPVEVLEGLTSDVKVPSTNPLENKVPQLNPVEKFNPFKYENPLR